MSNQLSNDISEPGAASQHQENQTNNLLFTPSESSLVRDVYNGQTNDKTVAPSFPSLEIDFSESQDRYGISPTETHLSGPTARHKDVDLIIDPLDAVAGRDHSERFNKPSIRTMQGSSEVAIPEGVPAKGSDAIPALVKGEMDYIKNHPEIIELYKRLGLFTDAKPGEHKPQKPNLVVGPNGDLVATEPRPQDSIPKIEPGVIDARDGSDARALNPEDARDRAYIEQSLNGMDLDPKTLEIAKELSDIYFSNDASDMVEKLGKVFKEHVNDPEFEKAVRALVDAGAWNGVMIPMKIWKDGSFVIGNLETGGTFFRKNGTSQEFEGHRR